MKLLLSILLGFSSIYSFAITPKFMWVEVLNKNIKSGNGNFGIDVMGYDSRRNAPYKINTCSIGSTNGSFFNEVKIVGQLSDKEYIFEYFREEVAYGAPCPSGVFFKASLEDVIKH